jgi:hypothetical protein
MKKAPAAKALRVGTKPKKQPAAKAKQAVQAKAKTGAKKVVSQPKAKSQLATAAAPEETGEESSDLDLCRGPRELQEWRAPNPGEEVRALHAILSMPKDKNRKHLGPISKMDTMAKLSAAVNKIITAPGRVSQGAHRQSVSL